MPWSALIVTDTDGTPLGELPNLDDRKIGYRLRRATTCSFTVNLRDRLSDAFLEADVLVKLYEQDPALIPVYGTDTVLRFDGPVQTAEEVGEDAKGTLAVVAADPAAELPNRLTGKSQAGRIFAEGVQRGDAAGQLLDEANGESNTLLRRGTINPTPALPTGGVGPWRYKPMLEALTELSVPLDGFDWEVRPIEPAVDATGVYCGLLDIWAAKGQRRENAIFEYGTGRHNMKKYRRTVDRTRMLNRAYSLPPGFPDNIPAGDSVLTSKDDASNARYRLQEGLIQSDLIAPTMRQQLIDQHVAVRARPRELITFDPQPAGYSINGRQVRVPRFKVDYDTGDIVTGRAVKHGRVRVNGLFRIYGADVSLSKTGVATVSPILQPEGT